MLTKNVFLKAQCGFTEMLSNSKKASSLKSYIFKFCKFLQRHIYETCTVCCFKIKKYV